MIELKQTYGVLGRVLIFISAFLCIVGIFSIGSCLFILGIGIIISEVIDRLTKIEEANKKTQELLEKQLSNAHQQTK